MTNRDFDMDLDRDAESAFGPQSLSAGAILPHEGRTFTTSPGWIPTALAAERDGWLSPNNPHLVRGLARVVPLAWRGQPHDGSGVTAQEIATFASHMQDAGMYWAGPWRVLDLAEQRRDSIGSYTAALVAAGATHVDCWTYSDTVGLALVWAGDVDVGTMSLAFHVVPVSWVSERLVERAVSGIDVGWSWADVIALHPVDLSEAIDVYLTGYPRSNEDEFRACFPDAAVRDSVQEILDETMRVEPDWEGTSLSEISQEVRKVMSERHPELPEAALRRLGNYFSYLVK